MPSFHQASLNHVKSYLGKRVNVHMMDGSVIVNVKITGAGKLNKRNVIRYTCNSSHGILELWKVDYLDSSPQGMVC